MSRFLLTAAGALLALAASAWAAPASATAPERSRRVVLLETPAALERALRTALMPWGMRVARSQARARPRPPKGAEQARSLARRLHADALVWLAPVRKQHELWLYDGTNGTLTTRSVPAPPFDETRAAALALSVKTELRKGTLADAAPAVSDAAAKSVPVAGKDAAGEDTPVKEAAASDAAPPAASAAPPPQLASRGAIDATPSPPSRAPRLRAPVPSPEVDTGSSDWTPWVPSDAPSWKLVLHGAARVGATTLGGTEGRYAVEGRWAPWADPSAPATLWLAGRVDLGLARPVENERFAGDYTEVGGGLGLGMSLPLNRWFELGMQLGAALRVGRVSGTFVADQAPGERTLLGLDLHIRPELELSLGTFGILLQPGLGVSPRRQRYESEEVEVLETHPVWWQLGAGVRVALD
jgi:hypothetical protein